MGAERWDEQVGSVADEASRLLESLRRSAAAAAQAGADAGESPDATGSPSSTAGLGPEGGAAGSATDSGAGATPHDPFCTYCPLCRGAAVIRSLSPETLSRLADLAGLAATVLADLASTRAAGDPAASTPAPGPTPAATSRPIPVHDADDPQEAPRG